MLSTNILIQITVSTLTKVSRQIILALAFALGIAIPAFAGDTLPSGYAMPPGSRLDSPSGCFSLVQQTDGNLVLYNNYRRQALWHTGTYNRAVKWTTMQGDGNFVMYNPSNQAIWASGTNGRGGTKLVMQNDANAVIYRSNGQAVWATNTLQACGNETPTQSSNGLPTTTGQANNYFKTQYYSNWNPNGPSASNNCGPTSLAMLRKLFGKEAGGISVQDSINQARQLMNAPGTGNTSDAQLKTGIANSGLRYDDRMYNGTWEQLDRDLAAGKAIIGWGYYDTQWRSQFPNYNQTGSGRTDHLNTILGKTANGNYLVGDPMYTGGAVEMTRDRLAVYFSNGGGGHDGRPYYLAVYR
jgi:hypothetical protein